MEAQRTGCPLQVIHDFFPLSCLHKQNDAQHTFHLPYPQGRNRKGEISRIGRLAGLVAWVSYRYVVLRVSKGFLRQGKGYDLRAPPWGAGQFCRLDFRVRGAFFKVAGVLGGLFLSEASKNDNRAR